MYADSHLEIFQLAQHGQRAFQAKVERLLRVARDALIECGQLGFPARMQRRRKLFMEIRQSGHGAPHTLREGSLIGFHRILQCQQLASTPLDGIRILFAIPDQGFQLRLFPFQQFESLPQQRFLLPPTGA